MESFVAMTNELPMIMAPASLIAALLTVSLIRAAIQFSKKPIKIMAIGVMLALTAGTLVVQSMS